jgi:hypothetical protein
MEVVGIPVARPVKNTLRIAVAGGAACVALTLNAAAAASAATVQQPTAQMTYATSKSAATNSILATQFKSNGCNTPQTIFYSDYKMIGNVKCSPFTAQLDYVNSVRNYAAITVNCNLPPVDGTAVGSFLADHQSENVAVGPGHSTVVSFSFPTKSGTYNFIADVSVLKLFAPPGETSLADSFSATVKITGSSSETTGLREFLHNNGGWIIFGAILLFALTVGTVIAQRAPPS